MARMMGRIALGLVLALLIVTVWLGWRLVDRSGMFAALEPVAIAGCNLIPGTVGGEDLTIDRATGWVFVAAHDRRATATGAHPRGAIYAAHIDSLDGGFLDLTAPTLPGALPVFGPHGLSLHSGPQGTRLAVVNHRSRTDTSIELYAVDYTSNGDGSAGVTPSLRHLRSIESPLFTQPNDVLLVGPESFYVTNDHHYVGGWREQAETYLGLDVATLVYGEGDAVRVAAGGLSYPNGVNISPDGRVIYVTETTDGVLRVYDRDIATGDLSLRSRIPMGRGPDNIDVTPDGTLWIAGHPHPMKLSAHAADPATPSPSDIVRLRVDANGEPGEREVIYLDEGAQFSGASVAVFSGGRLLAGSVYGNRLLSCPFAEP